jgi:group I intron endonuclease
MVMNYINIMQKIISIYKIQCNSTQKVYIGSSYNTNTRWICHRCLLRKNKHHSSRLQKSWNKYGENNFSFDIIEILPTSDFLIEREQFWIDYYDSYNLGFNGRPKAENNHHHVWTDEQRAAQSKRMTGRKINMTQEQKHLRSMQFRGENNAKSILNEDSVRDIVLMSNDGMNAMAIGRRLGINHSTVMDVLDRRTWNHVTSGLDIKKTSPKGSGHPNSKLTENQVLEIKQRIKNGETQKNIAKDYGISDRTVGNIKRGESWSHLTV